MNILLIFPPSTIYGSDPTIPAVTVPLGLAYIAGYLEKHGYKSVKILDARSLSKERVLTTLDSALYGLSDDEIRDHIVKFSPDIVGISCMYTAYSGDTHRVAAIIKKISRGIVVAMGGAHASTFSRLVLKDANVDIVVHSEGEETFLEVVRNIENKKTYTQIKGISFRDKEGNIIINSPREFIGNLDTIPFPARHLLDMDLYIDNKPGPYLMRAPSTTIVTSRGCPNLCIYCTIQSVWGERKWRGRSPSNVVDEMELLNREYGIREFHWMDDSAGTSKQRLADICLQIKKRKLDITWTTPNGIAHWTLDEPTLRQMKEAGCYRITFGIESGNKETRKFLGKPFSLEQAKRMLNSANRLGMWTICTFIIGFPFETKEAIMDTIDFACACGTDMAVFYLLCPHPGTMVYDIFKEEGLFNLGYVLDPSISGDSKSYEEAGLKLAGRGVSTKFFSAGELRQFLTYAYKSFFKAAILQSVNPVRVVSKIRSVEDLRYTYKIGSIGIKTACNSIFRKSFASQSMWEHRKNNLRTEKDASR